MALKVTDETPTCSPMSSRRSAAPAGNSRQCAATARTYLYVNGHLAGLRVQVIAHADKVCEPVDPQPVIERRCPQLDAVIAEAQEGGEQ